jgi:tRNA threonylcarbamoyladenosine biosynthesis protein TsaE
MGVGKTQFTKGVAKAMQIEEEVVSPTYSLEQEYGDGKLYHIDVWRIQKPNELIEIGFDEILKNKDAVVSIEWAEKVLDILRKRSEDAIIVWVKIAFGKQINERIISWGTL